MIEEIRKLRNHEPFAPYTISLTDGRRLHIKDRYHVAFGGKMALVYDEQNDRLLYLYSPSVSGVTADESVSQPAQ